MELNLEQEHFRFARAFVLFVVLLAMSLGILTGCGNSEASDTSDTIEISEEDAEKMVELVDDIANMDAQDSSAEEIYTYLDSLDWVESVRYEDDGNISCRTTFGVTAVWTEETEGYISSVSLDSDKGSLEEQLQIVEKYAGNGLDIVILCPYASTDSDFIIDGYKDMANKIAEEVSGSVTLIKDDDVSLECLKSLDKYDMVFFYSHGCLSSVLNSPWALAPSDPYTMTGEFADSVELYTLFSSDFLSGRTVVNLSSGRIGIGGGFYTYYYEGGDLENMFFHFGSCNSMHTSSISDALLSLGATWVEGWSDSVTFDNDFMHMYGMGACLLSGYSTGESVDLILADENVQQYAQDDCKFVTAGDGTYQITVKKEGTIITMVYTTEADGSLTALSGASVTVADSNGNTVETAVTSDSNGYSFVLPAGTYTITSELEGYETASKEISLAENDVLNVDFKMERSAIDVAAYLDNYQELVSKLNMQSTDYWQFPESESYVIDGFYLEWAGSHFSMKEESNSPITLYGCELGDNSENLVRQLEENNWFYMYDAVPSGTYYGKTTPTNDQYLLIFETDDQGAITYWYLNNWPEGENMGKYYNENQEIVSNEYSNWKSAYATILTDWKTIENYCDTSYIARYFDSDYQFDEYFLYDLNQDSTPELFLYSSTMGLTEVFTYSDSLVWCGENNFIGINTRNNELIVNGHWRGSGGSGAYEWSSYLLTNQTLECITDIDILGDRYTVYQNGNYINGTKATYDAIYNQHFADYTSYNSLTRYALSDASELDAW